MSLANDDIISLIVKHINHNDSENDRSALDDWAHLSEHNKKFVDQHVDENFIAERLKDYCRFDVDKGWKNVLSKSKAIKTGKRSMMKWIGSALLLIVIVAVAYFISRKDRKISTVTPVVAAPGNYERKLVLKDGYISTPAGRRYQGVLPDGSKVWLNAVSSLKFPDSFNDTLRRVELTGEAYFEIVKDDKRPFSVSIQGADIHVSGTGLNVKAYKEEKVIKITLLQGSAQIVAGSSHARMKGNQQARMVNVSGSMNILVQDIEPEYNLAWKKGDFNFEHSDLQSILHELSRWYNIEIVYEKQPAADDLYSGIVSRSKTLREVMGAFQRNGVSYEIKDNLLIIK